MRARASRTWALIATQLLAKGKEDLASFLLYLDSQVPARPRRAGARRGRRGRSSRASSRSSTTSRRSSTSSRRRRSSRSRRTSRSGGSSVGTLRQDPNLGVLFRENLRPVLDRESKQSLAPGPRQPARTRRSAGRSRRSSSRSSRGSAYAERVSRRGRVARDAQARAPRSSASSSPRATRSSSFISKRRLRPRFDDGTPEAEGLDRLVAAFEAEVAEGRWTSSSSTSSLMKDPTPSSRGSRTRPGCSGTSSSRASSASPRRSRRASTRARSSRSTGRGSTRAFA